MPQEKKPFSIDSEGIQAAYERLMIQTRIYNENKEYVRGANPEILRAERKKDPDNRVPVALAKSAVDDLTGYAGSEIVVSYKPVDKEGFDENQFKEYQNVMRKYQGYNDDDIVTSRLYKEALSHVESYLLLWTTDDLNLPNGLLTAEYAVIGMNEMVVIYDDEIKPNLLAGIRFVESDHGKDKKLVATVYKAFFAEVWEKGKEDGAWIKTNETIQYPYKKAPVAVAKIDVYGGPLFQAEKVLIDKHDSIISKSQNEIDRFNALLALFPDKVTAEFVKKMEEMKAIDELGEYERWPEYLEKNLEGVNEYTNNLLDRYERLFHKTIKVVDFNQITVDGGGGAESGTARAFKLLGMEFKASEIEKCFNKVFMQRTELFNDVINASTLNINTDNYQTVVTAQRNLPIDDLVKLQIIQGLLAIGVTIETALKIAPKTLIEDPEAEAILIKEIEDLNRKTMANMGAIDGE